MGTLDDKETITRNTKAVPIVIHAATADHLPSVEAVIDGVRRRAAQNMSTIFIHTSGTSELVDNSRGNSVNDTIYTDKDPAFIDSKVCV